jgi:hypothetical protein
VNCKDVDKLIIDSLDGNLTDDEKASVEKHIASCLHHKEEIAILTEAQDNLRAALKLRVAGYSSKPDAWERLKDSIVKEERAKVLKPGLTDSILDTIRNFVENPPVVRYLSWKTGLIALLVISITVILAVTAPLIVGPDSEVLAIDVALNSQEVQTALGGRLVDEAEVAATLDAEQDVFISIRVSDDCLLIVEVNPGTKEVIQLQQIELTDEIKQKAIDISMTDPRVRDLFEQGASVSSFFLTYYIEIVDDIGSDGAVYKEGSVEFGVIIKISLYEDEYVASINLDTEEFYYLQGPIK